MKRIAILAVLLVASLGVFAQMTATSAHAEDQFHGANDLLRRLCEANSGECAVGIGESVVGAVIIYNGVEMGSCFTTSAPSGVKVRAGVINYWAGEIAGKAQCNFAQQPAPSTPSSGTVNGLERRQCESWKGQCPVNQFEAVVGAVITFQGVQYHNCYITSVPFGDVTVTAGVINYWPGEPGATNAGQCSFSSGQSTTPPTGNSRLIFGSIPARGYGLVVFTGGSTMELLLASGCTTTGAFWAANNSGGFVTYISGAPTVVNTAWNTRFASGIPANTPLIARCR